MMVFLISERRTITVCLHYLLPYVGNMGTISTNDIISGTIGKTLNGICLPMVPFLPLVRTMNARHGDIFLRCQKSTVIS